MDVVTMDIKNGQVENSQKSKLSAEMTLKVDIPVELFTTNAGSSPTMALGSSIGVINGVGGAPKLPITVQQWVDSIDMSSTKTSSDFRRLQPDSSAQQICKLEDQHSFKFPSYVVDSLARTTNTVVTDEHLDNLDLGAEAQHLEESVILQVPVPLSPSSKRQRLSSNIENSQSFQSELSATSSTSSVSALLETMRIDPEEILTNLGFGSPVESSSPLARIPRRFLQNTSLLRGNSLTAFLERYNHMQEMNDTALSGYLGLSGYRTDGHSPSGIVSKILEKIVECNREQKRACLGNRSTPSVAIARPSFFQTAYSVMAANAFRNSIRPSSHPTSILEPKNRELLDKRISNCRNQKSRPRRLVLGKHSLTVNSDEELVDDDQIESEKIPLERQISDEVFAKEKLNLEVPVPVTLNASSKRTNYRLNKQFSVVDDSTYSDEFAFDDNKCSSLPPHYNHRTKFQSKRPEVSWNSTKESFELEELPSNANDDHDEDDEWSTGGASSTANISGLHADCTDVPRTGSSMSDSSGFLEFESADQRPAVKDIVDIIETMSEYVDTDTNQSTPLESSQEDLTKEKCLDQSTETLTNKSIESDCFAQQSKLQSDFLSNMGVDWHEFNRDRSHSTCQISMDVCTSSNLTKSRSEACLDISESNVHRRRMDVASGRVATLTRFWSNIGSDGNSLHKAGILKHQADEEISSLEGASFSVTSKVITDSRSYTVEINRMREAVTEYTEQLRQMSRSCCDMYDRVTQNMTKKEKNEMEKLDELRSRIINEASRTSSLLEVKNPSKEMTGNRLYTITKQLEVLLDCQREFNTQLSKVPLWMAKRRATLKAEEISSVESNDSTELFVVPPSSIVNKVTFQQMKEEILKEVRTLLHTDQQAFLQDIKATHRGIEDVKDVVIGLLNIIQKMSKPD